MKFNTLADFEIPRFGAVTGFPTLSQFGYQIARGGHLGQVVAQLTELHVHHVMVKNLAWIQHVAGCPTGNTLTKSSALFGCGKGPLHVKPGHHCAKTHR